MLVHNDYATELTETLSKKGVKFDSTFDPCSPSVLKDPKYATHTLEQRQEIAKDLHHQRILKALTFIRDTAKFAVARYFANKNWITHEQLAAVLATDIGDVFITDDTDSTQSDSDSSYMDDAQEGAQPENSPENRQ